MNRSLVGVLVVALLGLACQKGLSAPDEGAAPEAIRDATGPAPEISVTMRGDPVAGRPVPYRIIIENRTREVIVPISAEARTGAGGTRWARPIVGEVRYDAQADRYVENPVAQRASSQSLFGSTLAPGESLVEDFEVRYGTTGELHETFRIVYHRLAPSAFEERAYVASGTGLPRRYLPLGLLSTDARKGALLAGFFLREPGSPEAASGTFSFTMPSVPAPIAARMEKAGYPPDRAIAAPWAGGWVTGDGEASVVVAAAAVRKLAGIPFDAMRMIDATEGNVSFCITGASREEVTALFPGREIVPYKCLHVSVPRADILPSLERISAGGFRVEPIEFQLREALDVVRGATAAAAPAATPASTPAATPKPTSTPTSRPSPTATPTSRPSPSATPTSSPSPTSTPDAAETAIPEPTAAATSTPRAAPTSSATPSASEGNSP